MLVPAGKFKATCLELMDRVASTGEEVVITKHGKPVAKLVAARRARKAPRSVHGCMRGTILALAPIAGLLSTNERWDANGNR